MPRPIPCLALLFALMAALPAPAERKEPLGIAPPQPIPLNVRVQRGGKTEIPLRIYGRANQPVNFLIRVPPTQGKLSEPRPTEREEAVVVYEPPANLSIKGTKFSYAAQSAVGVSAAADVFITIVDQPAQLVIPERLDFPATRAGLTSSAFLEVSNRGGVVAEGEVLVNEPWRIEGSSRYRLAPGDLAVFKILFTPVTGGAFDGLARFTSENERSTSLHGTADTAIVPTPERVVLRSRTGDSPREAEVELSNQTDEARTLRLATDTRLEVPEEVTVPAKGKITVPIRLKPGDVQPITAELRFVAADFSLSVPVKAGKVGALVRATPDTINFGHIPIGKTIGAAFTIENAGTDPAEVSWKIGAPFRVNPSSALLVPGERRSYTLEINPTRAGKYRGWLEIQAGAQSLEIGVHADVVAAPTPARTPPKMGGVPKLSAPEFADPETPLPADGPETNWPADWFGDKVWPPGVRVTCPDPITVVIEWPATLAEAITRYRVDIREIVGAPDGTLRVQWPELLGLNIKLQDGVYSTTIRGLIPAQAYTIRIVAMPSDNQLPYRLFAVDFTTPRGAPPKPRQVVTPARVIGASVVVMLVWQVVKRWRRRSRTT